MPELNSRAERLREKRVQAVGIRTAGGERLSLLVDKRRLFVDGFGRIYFDSCKTDEEHLTKPPEEGEERTRCRFYIGDAFEVFEKYKGVKGTWHIALEFHPEEG